MNAEVATEIENAREKAKSDHQSMIDVQSTVTLLTTLTAAIWIGNALEAVISFPKYDLAVGPEGGTLNLSLVNNYGQIKPSISYKVPIR